MTQNEAKLIAAFMQELSDRFGNDGCNDYDLPATPENRQLIMDAQKWGRADEVPTEPREYNGKYCTYNWEILSYLRHKFMEENGLTE